MTLRERFLCRQSYRVGGGKY
eukprot:SAG31_NODE_38568_length_295_cov_0.790816_1_plen_20_part_01